MDPTQKDHHASHHSPLHPLRYLAQSTKSHLHNEQSTVPLDVERLERDDSQATSQFDGDDRQHGGILRIHYQDHTSYHL